VVLPERGQTIGHFETGLEIERGRGHHGIVEAQGSERLTLAK
jgi:hypothetical protein